jgi:hypothetical protein
VADIDAIFTAPTKRTPSKLQGAGDVTGLSNEAQRKQKGPASTGPSKTLELQP